VELGQVKIPVRETRDLQFETSCQDVGYFPSVASRDQDRPHVNLFMDDYYEDRIGR